MAEQKKLPDQVRDVIRFKHYSVRTEEAYVDWIRRYILFYKKSTRPVPSKGRIDLKAVEEYTQAGSLYHPPRRYFRQD